LFIGNSFTYYNDLPGILESLADSPDSPRRVHASKVTIPGASLEELWFADGTRRTIRWEHWDYVILQENRQILARDPDRSAEFARLFDTEIKQAGAKTISFLAWTSFAQRQAQPAMNQASYRIAKEIGAKVAPVGPAWTIAKSLDPGIDLYAGDERHPSRTGSYVAACTIYLVVMENQNLCPVIDLWGISRNDIDAAREASARAISELP
jgi:hypothetical protein